MSRGRRYNYEPRLNYKKVLAVIITIVVIVMFIYVVKNLLSNGKEQVKMRSTSYFSIYEDNKWGVMDSAGNEIITPSYAELIVIPNKAKDVFLCTYDVEDSTGAYKTKALDSKNEEIFTNYSQIEPIENADNSGNTWYEQNLLKVKKDSKYGLINLDGKEILSCEYDNIYALEGITNSIIVVKDGKFGLVDSNGNQVIDTQYKEIKNFGKDYKQGYIIKNQDNKCGVVSYSKIQVLPNQYEDIKQVYGTSLFVISESGKQKVIKQDGTVVIGDGFDSISQILDGTTQGVVFVKNGKYGVMNADAKVIIDPTYDYLKQAKSQEYIAKKDGKYGVINQDKNVKLEFKYTGISYDSIADIFVAEDSDYNSVVLDGQYNEKLKGIVSEINTDKGYLKIRINDEYKYYNFKFEEKKNTEIFSANDIFLSKQNGKYGYVDKQGKTVVDYIYDDATEENEYGYASVKKDGLWGSIDENGKVVLSPKYNLDEFVIVNFIGKWHYGKDINMNYYSQEE